MHSGSVMKRLLSFRRSSTIEGISPERPLHSGRGDGLGGGVVKFVIAVVLLLAVLALGQTWVVEQVDSTAASGSPVELVKAADGRLWAGYQTRGGAARVACLGDPGWSFSDVCSLARLPSTHFRPFLAASPHGELCLACWDSTTDTNRLYRMVDDTWRSEPNPYNDSPPCNTVAYDTSGRLYALYSSYLIGASFGMGHESDSGWTCSFVVQLPAYGWYVMGPDCHLTTAADGRPWFFGFCGWEDGPPKWDCETNLLHFTGDSWESVWDKLSYSYGEITPIPIALVPHGAGVGSLTWRGYVRYDTSETVMVVVSDPYHPPIAGLAYTADDVPLVAVVPGLWTSARKPLFAFKTNRWRTESIPGPAGIGGIDMEVDTTGQVIIVYSTKDSGLWCARGTDVVGAEESPKPQAPSRKLAATVIRSLPQGAVAFDAMGRRVVNPKSGVYFVRSTVCGEPSAVAIRKVVIQR
jgi:hypothetical protein